ncbi:MAG: DUF3617 domain-containing protein [Pseudomonadota bacterium]
MRNAFVAAVVLASAVAVGAQTIDPGMKPQPGEYESRIEVISVSIPGMPANMADMMRGAMNRTTKFCLTEEDVEEGFKAAMRRSQDGDCQFERFNAVGGKIDAVMICQTETGPMTMNMNGTGTPTQSDVTMTVSGDMGMGEGPMNMEMRVIQNRLGSC